MELITLTLIFVWLAIIVALTLLLHKKAGIPTFYTRKILHIGTAFVWIIGALTIGGTWHMFIPNTLSFLAIAASYFMKPIEGIESERKAGEPRNFGTLYFAIATMLITACNFSELLYPIGGLSFCSLAFGDGLAAVFGRLAKTHNPKLCGNKTLIGLATCFTVTLAVCSVFNFAFSLGFSPLALLAIAGVVSIAELYTPFGLDNITIPLFAFLLALGLRLALVPESVLFVFAISPLFAVIALTKRVFTPVAAASAFFILTAFAWMSGYVWVLNIFIGYGFVILAKLVRHVVMREKNLKSNNSEAEEKHGKSLTQLAANLFFPLAFTALYFFFKIEAVAVGAFASFASAISDSMASDIGVLQKAKPFDICRFKRVEPGVSGGISLLGSSMALLAASVHMLVFFFLAKKSLTATFIVGAVAILGVIVDSILGSLVQGKYKCRVCGKQLEGKLCCNEHPLLIQGFKFVNNNTVNVISNGTAAILGTLTALLII